MTAPAKSILLPLSLCIFRLPCCTCAAICLGHVLEPLFQDFGSDFGVLGAFWEPPGPSWLAPGAVLPGLWAPRAASKLHKKQKKTQKSHNITLPGITQGFQTPFWSYFGTIFGQFGCNFGTFCKAFFGRHILPPFWQQVRFKIPIRAGKIKILPNSAQIGKSLGTI